MGTYNSTRELAQKMDNEGGLAEFFFGYGVTEDDLPDDIPGEMFEKILGFLKQVTVYEEIQSYIFEHLDDEPVPGDWDYKDEE